MHGIFASFQKLVSRTHECIAYIVNYSCIFFITWHSFIATGGQTNISKMVETILHLFAVSNSCLWNSTIRCFHSEGENMVYCRIRYEFYLRYAEANFGKEWISKELILDAGGMQRLRVFFTIFLTVMSVVMLLYGYFVNRLHVSCMVYLWLCSN